MKTIVSKEWNPGLTKKFVLFLVFFKTFCALSIIGMLYWQTKKITLIQHAYIAIAIIFFFQFLIYMSVKKIKKRNHIICGLLHEYAEEGENIGEEFSGPKKNIKKSFDSQQDGLNKTDNAMNEIRSMIARTQEQVNDCNEIIKIA
jgi:hypothetical protein